MIHGLLMLIDWGHLARCAYRPLCGVGETGQRVSGSIDPPWSTIDLSGNWFELRKAEMRYPLSEMEIVKPNPQHVQMYDPFVWTVWTGWRAFLVWQVLFARYFDSKCKEILLQCTTQQHLALVQQTCTHDISTAWIGLSNLISFVGTCPQCIWKNICHGNFFATFRGLRAMKLHQERSLYSCQGGIQRWLFWPLEELATLPWMVLSRKKKCLTESTSCGDLMLGAILFMPLDFTAWGFRCDRRLWPQETWKRTCRRTPNPTKSWIIWIFLSSNYLECSFFFKRRQEHSECFYPPVSTWTSPRKCWRFCSHRPIDFCTGPMLPWRPWWFQWFGDSSKMLEFGSEILKSQVFHFESYFIFPIWNQLGQLFFGAPRLQSLADHGRWPCEAVGWILGSCHPRYCAKRIWMKWPGGSPWLVSKSKLRIEDLYHWFIMFFIDIYVDYSILYHIISPIIYVGFPTFYFWFLKFFHLFPTASKRSRKRLCWKNVPGLVHIPGSPHRAHFGQSASRLCSVTVHVGRYLVSTKWWVSLVNDYLWLFMIIYDYRLFKKSFTVGSTWNYCGKHPKKPCIPQ